MANASADIGTDECHIQFQTPKQYAVCVRDASKYYGTKKNPVIVLDHLNMNVPKGVIYGLLGASGCGKTTLLSCIVGGKKLNSGKIWVLGNTLDSGKSGVTGSLIGYMPQDLAQYGEFSIKETLMFYGCINDMTNDEIIERTEFLLQLLMLPDCSKTVNTLSIGQQRRVSLATALLHKPKLLILDEPTVGVDPLLREIIWNHFVDITENNQTTIIITTHYIEETRKANLIALMRGGLFLAEESPENLLRQMGTQTLEDAFLQLSVIQNRSHRQRCGIGIDNKSVVLDNIDDNNVSQTYEDLNDHTPTISYSNEHISIKFENKNDDNMEHVPTLLSKDCFPWKINHMKALIWKNFLWMMRNVPMMIFLIAIPALQVTLYCLCIGHDPINLPIAVVNYETDGIVADCEKPLACNSTRLSCNYLKHLEERSLILIPYDSEASAADSLMKGKTYASVVIQHNYSAALQARIRTWEAPRIWNVKNSKIEVTPDHSNRVIADFLRISFYDTFKAFIKDYLESCKLDGRMLEEPVRWETPIYGVSNPDFTNFVTPGILMSLIFSLGACLTTFLVFTERHEGIYQRYLVAGITELELLSSHFVNELVISICQTISAMVFAFAVFRITMIGSLMLATALVMLCGICGMCYGFLISVVSDNEQAVNNIILGSFLPLITFSGVMWPIESMHYVLQTIANVLPITKPGESLRSILQRGLNLSDEKIYTGFLILSIWTCIFFIGSILIVKYRKN